LDGNWASAFFFVRFVYFNKTDMRFG